MLCIGVSTRARNYEGFELSIGDSGQVDPIEGDVVVLSDVRSENFPQIYYDIANEDHFWCKWRLAAFVQQLKDLDYPLDADLKGIEIGCGNGLVRRQLEKISRWEIDGADIDLQALKTNHTERGKTYLYDIHDRHADLGGQYDFLILWDVIEHIDDEGTDAFIESCLFLLKPGGRIFVNVPALQSLWSEYDALQGHFRRYDKEMMRSQFDRSGLSPDDLRYWGLSLIPILKARKFLLKNETDSSATFTKGFKPPSPLVNSALCGLLSIETTVMSRAIRGTSLLATATKPE